MNLPSYPDRLKILNIHSLADRRDILSSCFIFDILHNNIDDPYLCGRVIRNDEVRQTRHTKFLKEVKHRTEYGKNEPINRGIITFNKYADCHNDNITKQTFKNKIKKLLNN